MEGIERVDCDGRWQHVDPDPEEIEADRILREAGAFANEGDHSEYPCWTERDLVYRTAREIALGDDVPFTEYALFPPGQRPTLRISEMLKHLTRNQRETVRLMQKYQNQTKVGEVMGKTQAAVSGVLIRAYLRIMELHETLRRDEQPSDFGRWLWFEEQRTKFRQVYRAPRKAWMSAYRHDWRWDAVMRRRAAKTRRRGV